MTLDQLADWIERERPDYGSVPARIVCAGEARPGHLGVQHWSDGTRKVHVALSGRRKGGTRYQTVLPRHLEDGSPCRLEIKVGARYRPATEVVA